jgi:type IV pilus assembly protein PilW
MRKPSNPPTKRSQRGLSLIELMVALTIGLLLSFGILQIFSASKTAYQLQEGLSRIQENGRFAAQFLQGKLRMAGFMGCGNDMARSANGGFINHLARYGGNPLPELRFQRPVEGFSFSGELDAGAAPTVGAKGDWTPELPDGLDAKVVKGTDVLILRVFSEDSTPVTRWVGNPNNFTIRDSGFVEEGGIYAVENCGSAHVFEAETVDGAEVEAPGEGANIYRDPSTSPVVAWGFDATNVNYLMPAGNVLNAEVHRAEYLAVYVGLRNDGGGVSTPALYVQHLPASGVVSGGDVATSTDELADGIENMQLRFGLDTDNDSAVDTFETAEEIADGFTSQVDLDDRWRAVRSVRVGLLVRGEPRAGVSTTRPYRVTDVTVVPPSDRRMRDVYETTIALRNRIYNS